jgi:hypothetical protein
MEQETQYSKAKKEVAKVTPKTRRKPESKALEKYKKFRKIARLYALKKELNAAGFPEPYNAGHEARRLKYHSKMVKARKMARHELIQISRTNARSRNKGGGVGSRLTKIK